MLTFIFIDILEREKKNVLELFRGPKREPIEPYFEKSGGGCEKKI